MFGSNSRLTNGKHDEKKVRKGEEKVVSMQCEDEAFNESLEENKKMKIIDTIHNDNEDEDSDNDFKNNNCTSSYCPPCYELA